MPKRIQRRRTKGWRLPENTVIVSRPTKWGNPYSIDPASKLDAYSRISAVEFYKVHLERNPQLVEDAKRELRGKDLACWCAEGEPCHGDVLLELCAELDKGVSDGEAMDAAG